MTSADPDRGPELDPVQDPALPETAGAGPSSRRRVALMALAVLAGAAGSAFALYGMNGLTGNALPPQNTAAPGASLAGGQAVGKPGDTSALCADTARRAETLTPLVTGEAAGDMAKLNLAGVPRPLPALTFTGPQGQVLGLQDFRGKVLLINLWATWCAPCRKEMPALDRLQAELGGPDFEVVTINLDQRDPARPRAFFEEVGVRHLALYTDSGNSTFQALRSVGRAFGLPATVLVDEEGCELGFLAGPAQWDGAPAQALIRAAKGLRAAAQISSPAP